MSTHLRIKNASLPQNKTDGLIPVSRTPKASQVLTSPPFKNKKLTNQNQNQRVGVGDRKQWRHPMNPMTTPTANL
jgi:hypothetical protein